MIGLLLIFQRFFDLFMLNFVCTRIKFITSSELLVRYPDVKQKELSLCHKFNFCNPYIFVTWWCKPLIFQTTLFDLIAFIVWNIKGLWHWVATILKLVKQILWQKLNSFELFGSIHFCLLTVLNFVLFNLTFSSLCSSGFLRVLLQLFLILCSVLVYVHVYSSIWFCVQFFLVLWPVILGSVFSYFGFHVLFSSVHVYGSFWFCGQFFLKSLWLNLYIILSIRESL